MTEIENLLKNLQDGRDKLRGKIKILEDCLNQAKTQEQKKQLKEEINKARQIDIKIGRITGLLKHGTGHFHFGILENAIKGGKQGIEEFFAKPLHKIEGTLFHLNKKDKTKKGYNVGKWRGIFRNKEITDLENQIGIRRGLDIAEMQEEKGIKPIDALEFEIDAAKKTDYTGDVAKEGGIKQDVDFEKLFTGRVYVDEKGRQAKGLNNLFETQDKIDLDKTIIEEEENKGQKAIDVLIDKVELEDKLNKELEQIDEFGKLREIRKKSLDEKEQSRLEEIKNKRGLAYHFEKQSDNDEYDFIQNKMKNVLDIEEIREYAKLKRKKKRDLTRTENMRLDQLERKKQSVLTREEKAKLIRFEKIIRASLNKNLTKKDIQDEQDLKEKMDKALINDLGETASERYWQLNALKRECLGKRAYARDERKKIANILREKIPILNKFKKIYEKGFLRIESEFLRNPTGFKTCQDMSDLRDTLINQLYKLTIENIRKSNPSFSFTENPPMAIMTFGGGGRREVSPFSDVDIAFISQKSKYDEECNHIYKNICNYMRIIGCGMESVDETAFRNLQGIKNYDDLLQKIKKDIVKVRNIFQKNKYAECRFICGDEKIWQWYDKIKNSIAYLDFEDGKLRILEVERILATKSLFENVIKEENFRYNVKSDKEGMRLMQNFCWMLAGIYNIRKKSMKDILEEAKAISRQESQGLIECYDFDLMLRNEIHYLYMREYEMISSVDIMARSKKHGERYEQMVKQLSAHFEKQRTLITTIKDRIKKDVFEGKIEKEEIKEQLTPDETKDILEKEKINEEIKSLDTKTEADVEKLIQIGLSKKHDDKTRQLAIGKLKKYENKPVAGKILEKYQKKIREKGTMDKYRDNFLEVFGAVSKPLQEDTQEASAIAQMNDFAEMKRSEKPIDELGVLERLMIKTEERGLDLNPTHWFRNVGHFDKEKNKKVNGIINWFKGGVDKVELHKDKLNNFHKKYIEIKTTNKKLKGVRSELSKLKSKQKKGTASEEDNAKFNELQQDKIDLLIQRKKSYTEQKKIGFDLLQATPVLEKYKKAYEQGFLDIETLFLTHPNGLNTCIAMSELRDTLISELYELAIENVKKSNHSFPNNPPMAIISFGGYGRREVSPFSDVDLFFLFFENQKYCKECAFIREEVCNYLRIIGCGMQKIDESAAKSIMPVKNQNDLINKIKESSDKSILRKTQYIESRFICGDENIGNIFANNRINFGLEEAMAMVEGSKLAKQISFADIKNRKNWKYQIKKGSEGLRRMHSLCWALKGFYNIDIKKTFVKEILEELANMQKITPNEANDLIECYEYNLKLRNEIHYLYMAEQDMISNIDLKHRSKKHGHNYDIIIKQLSSHFDKQRNIVNNILKRLKDNIEIKKGELTEDGRKQLDKRVSKKTLFVKKALESYYYSESEGNYYSESEEEKPEEITEKEEYSKLPEWEKPEEIIEKEEYSKLPPHKESTNLIKKIFGEIEKKIGGKHKFSIEFKEKKKETCIGQEAEFIFIVKELSGVRQTITLQSESVDNRVNTKIKI